MGDSFITYNFQIVLKITSEFDIDLKTLTFFHIKPIKN